MSRCSKPLWLVITVVLSCIAMAVIETVIEPAYFVKSVLKILLFLLLPSAVLKILDEKVFSDSLALNKKSLPGLVILGLIVYAVVMVAYFLTGAFFDYSSLVNSLSVDQNVSPGSFIWVAAYISFGNSLLEEFLFRFVAFIKLSEYISKKAAYIISSCLFALYHVGMIGGSFPVPLLVLALLGLTVGGLIFDYADGKSRNIYNSWIIHMFADFAIMTIWYIHI